MGEAIFFLGIDAGGTSSKGRLVDASGYVLAQVQAGAGSLRAGATAVRSVIDELIAQTTFTTTQLAQTACAVGLAGVSLTDELNALNAMSFPFARIAFVSDAEIACIGAHAGGDGGVVIAGTGSIGIARVRGESHRIGGFGFPISDEGSGAEIGFRAIRAFCQMRDGRLPAGPLHDLLAPHIDTQGLAYWRDDAPPREFAQFAPQVFSAAERGDTIAQVIVANAAKEISKIANALVRLGAPHWSLMGGLAPLIAPMLSDDAKLTCVPAQGDAIEGALWLARV
jgi:glucosamine kinase